MTRIAVIGAGLSGLVVARELAEDNAVVVFEKSRGPGGRMATRYKDGFEFDHGAQFFTAKSREFLDYLQPMVDRGVVACWNVQFAELERARVAGTRNWDSAYPHFVGAPRMNAIGKFLAGDLDLRPNTPVALLEPASGGWRLCDDHGCELGRFDWVICAMPAAQVAALLPADSPLRRLADGTEMRSCFALMLGFDQPLALPWQAALVRDADISWVSVNSSKPGRSEKFTLVVHSTNAYADTRIDDDPNAVRSHLLHETSAILGVDCGTAILQQLQRWRYANAEKQVGPRCFFDPTMQLAGCGDWFVHGRVEAAFSSGLEVAQKLRSAIQ